MGPLEQIIFGVSLKYGYVPPKAELDDFVTRISTLTKRELIDAIVCYVKARATKAPRGR